MEHKADWSLEKLYPGIFHLSFAHPYDTAMHFLRYQENYESPFWRNKDFSLIQYMEWYAKNECRWLQKWKKASVKTDATSHMFSYPGDWGGFNVPSYVFDRITRDSTPDFNRYDCFMESITGAIRLQGYKKFYLIGTTPGPKSHEYLDHEVCHGFYYTSTHFKEQADGLLEDVSSDAKMYLEDWLLDGGYCEEVVDDETVAYFATGLPDKLKKNTKCKDACKPFQSLLKATVKSFE